MWGKIGQILLTGLVAGAVVLGGLYFGFRSIATTVPYNNEAATTLHLEVNEGKWENTQGALVDGPESVDTDSICVHPLREGQNAVGDAIVHTDLHLKGTKPELDGKEEYLFVMSPANIELHWKGGKIPWELKLKEMDGNPIAGYLFIVPKDLAESHEFEIRVIDQSKPRFI